MPRSVRLLTTLAVALCLSAFGAASASALSINSIQNGEHTNSTNLTITYSDPSGLTGANCVLDSSTPVACDATSAPLGNLSEGAHSLLVQGLVLMQGPCIAWMPPEMTVCVGWSMISSPVSATVSFTVDRTAPVVSITSGPGEGSSSTSTSASFGIDAGDGTVSCTIDGNSVSCGSTVDLTGLSAGAHQLVVSSTDLAGNVGSAVRNFVVAAAGAGDPPAKPEAKILSAPRSWKLGKKLMMNVLCPQGCKIAVVFKQKGARNLKASFTVKAGATTTTFSPNKKLMKKLKKVVKSHKIVATFSVEGGNSKRVSLK